MSSPFRCPRCRTTYANAYHGDHCRHCIDRECRCVQLVRIETWEPDNGPDFEDMAAESGDYSGSDAADGSGWDGGGADF